jgi:hypothetical protein
MVVNVTSNSEKGPGMKSMSQEDAVAEIKSLGGIVSFDADSGAVTNVFLDGTKITDASLEHLKEMIGLSLLVLSGTKITDAGLEHLKELTSLTSLRLYEPQITDTGLVHLKGLTSLTMLQLHDMQITDAGLEHLKELTSLTTLVLNTPSITDAGLAEIEAALPGCFVLGLTDNVPRPRTTVRRKPVAPPATKRDAATSDSAAGCFIALGLVALVILIMVLSSSNNQTPMSFEEAELRREWDMRDDEFDGPN